MEKPIEFLKKIFANQVSIKDEGFIIEKHSLTRIEDDVFEIDSFKRPNIALCSLLYRRNQFQLIFKLGII